MAKRDTAAAAERRFKERGTDWTAESLIITPPLTVAPAPAPEQPPPVVPLDAPRTTR